MPWLPNCVWDNVYPSFRYQDEEKAGNWDKGVLETQPYHMTMPDHPLLQHLTIEDLEWHFHGVFHAPEKAEVLLVYGDNADIIYIDHASFNGTILATTLDPDVHAGYGVVKKTQKFLDNVLNWACAD